MGAARLGPCEPHQLVPSRMAPEPAREEQGLGCVCWGRGVLDGRVSANLSPSARAWGRLAQAARTCRAPLAGPPGPCRLRPSSGPPSAQARPGPPRTSPSLRLRLLAQGQDGLAAQFSPPSTARSSWRRDYTLSFPVRSAGARAHPQSDPPSWSSRRRAGTGGQVSGGEGWA